MKFDAGSRTRILVDVTIEVDPTGTTVELRVDGTWYAATWLGTAVDVTTSSTARPRWQQTARTNGYFAGPDAVASGAVVLAAATQHPLEVRVTSGQDILTSDLPSLSII